MRRSWHCWLGQLGRTACELPASPDLPGYLWPAIMWGRTNCLRRPPLLLPKKTLLAACTWPGVARPRQKHPNRGSLHGDLQDSRRISPVMNGGMCSLVLDLQMPVCRRVQLGKIGFAHQALGDMATCPVGQVRAIMFDQMPPQPLCFWICL